MTGHLVLRKEMRDGAGNPAINVLGLRILGDQILHDGSIGAVVEKVKKGSIADQIGRLRPGDEVIEWNGRYGINLNEFYAIVVTPEASEI